MWQLAFFHFHNKMTAELIQILLWHLHKVKPTYDGSRLRRLDERQRAVIGLLGNVDKAVLQLVLLEDAVELVEEAHPFVPVLIAVSQDEDGGLVAAGGGELGRRHLGRQEKHTQS